MTDCKLCGKEIVDHCLEKYGICSDDLERMVDMLKVGMGLFGQVK